MEAIITVSGKAQVGKDYFSQTLKEYLEKEHNKKVVVIHYADYLKFICKEYYGWNGEKDEAGRTLLQKVGTDVVRKINKTFWVDAVVNFINAFKNEFDWFIIPDCRFPNEIDTLRYIYEDKFVSVNLHRKNHDGSIFENTLTGDQRNHPSETALDGYKNYDFYVENDGIHSSMVSMVRWFNQEVIWLMDDRRMKKLKKEKGEVV